MAMPIVKKNVLTTLLRVLEILSQAMAESPLVESACVCIVIPAAQSNSLNNKGVPRKRIFFTREEGTCKLL